MGESIIVALITGGLALIGVIITTLNSNRNIENKLTTAQAVTDVKIDNLTEEVRRHNGFAQKIPVIEQQIDDIKHRVNALESKTADDGK